MYSNQKKTSALALVLLLAFPLLFTVLLTLQQQALRIYSQGKFDTEIMLTIFIPKKDIVWVKKGKEVLINGKYFDVKQFNSYGDQLALTGYYDHKEDKLAGRIKNIFSKKDDSGSPINITAVKFLFFPVFTTQHDISLTDYFQFTRQHNKFFEEKIPEPPYFSFSPPPEV